MKIKKTTIAIILISLLAAAGIGGFIWSYSQMTHFRDNSEEIAAEAAEAARNEQSKIDEAVFNEKLKEPYKNFIGPSDLGSISFDYPLTWSAYNVKSDVNSYNIIFHPNIIPEINNNTPVALTIEVINRSYEDEISNYQNRVETGKLSASPITVSENQEGVLLSGNLNDNFTSSFVLLKLRDKTLLVRTDTDRYSSDFTNIILKSLKFVP